ncbi:MAG TPA: class I SAM-dependent methyltransferase, partial [Chthoniobacterales bacterium]|nr:class I SAM-dependent methyltransferase [Chthoniobacterales bacterium]
MQSNEYATMFRVEETHWWYRALHDLIFETLHRELPDWRSKKILDAGCGTGAILRRLGNPERNIGVDLPLRQFRFVAGADLVTFNRQTSALCLSKML